MHRRTLSPADNSDGAPNPTGKRCRVLFVSVNAPPKNTSESLQVAKVLKYLARHCDVSLVTTRQTGGWRPEDGSLQEVLGGLREVYSLHLPEQRILNALLRRLRPQWLRRPDEDFLFPSRAPEVVWRVRNRPHVIYSRATPHSSSLMARRLARHYRVPWVMHMSDPWSGNRFHEASADQRLTRWQEQSCIREATVVTVTSEATRELYRDRYPGLASKLEVFPNVYDPDDLNAQPLRRSLPFVIVHTGRLYGDRSPAPFVEALEHLGAMAPDVLDALRVHFYGFADERSIRHLARMAPTVEYRGAVSHGRALAAQREAHALLLIDPPSVSRESNVFLPSKLLDYIAARRPIIAMTGAQSTTRQILERVGGVASAHDQPRSLAAQILELYRRHEGGRSICDDLPPPPVEFSAAYHVEKLVELFERL